MSQSIRDRYDRFIWDMDGTLVLLRVDWHGLKERLRRELDEGADRPSAHDLLSLAEAQGRRDEIVARFAEAEIAGMEILTRRVAALRSVADKSAILTNNMSETVDQLLSRTDLDGLPYVARDRVARPKPDPEGLKRLVAHWRGYRSLLIGDSDTDAAVAGWAGIDFLQVEPRDTEIDGGGILGRNVMGGGGM